MFKARAIFFPVVECFSRMCDALGAERKIINKVKDSVP